MRFPDSLATLGGWAPIFKAWLRLTNLTTPPICRHATSRAPPTCWASADSDEGLAAFVEKRAAKYGAGPEPADAAPSAAARRFE